MKHNFCERVAENVHSYRHISHGSHCDTLRPRWHRNTPSLQVELKGYDEDLNPVYCVPVRHHTKIGGSHRNRHKCESFALLPTRNHAPIPRERSRKRREAK